jgi:hypothetical protein
MGHIVYLVRKKITYADLDVSLADKLSSRPVPVSVTYRRPGYFGLHDMRYIFMG